MNIKLALQSRMPQFFGLQRDRQIMLGSLVGLAVLVIAMLLSANRSDLPDMKSIEDVNTRKATFFDYLTPAVKAVNDEIRTQRASLQAIAAGFKDDNEISFFDEYRLKSLARQYRVEWVESDPAAVIRSLQKRIDVVPVPLVLVQAAKESGWGTSRFAREGNNLFGQWCYSEGCGIVPARRAGEAKHEVKVFDSIEDAIRAYLHNINTGRAYHDLRQIRARLRANGRDPDGAALADGLLYYSQRREAYVDEVKRMLEQYRQFRQQQG